MLKFYYNGAPNPAKVALFLEEAGLPYEPIPIYTRNGDQHKPEFLAINPNAKVPAIVDGDVNNVRLETPFCSISPRRPENSCRQKKATRRAANCCRG